MKKWIRKTAFGIVVLLVVVTGAFIWWGNNPLEAMPEAIMALESDHTVLGSSTFDRGQVHH